MPFRDSEKERIYKREHQRRWNKIPGNREKRAGYSAKWRAKNPHYARQKYEELSIVRRGFLNWLKELPCTDCCKAFHPVCMDFDHVKGDTVLNVGNMLLWNWERFSAEILKCEIVCANCHRLRTFNIKETR